MGDVRKSPIHQSRFGCVTCEGYTCFPALQADDISPVAVRSGSDVLQTSVTFCQLQVILKIHIPDRYINENRIYAIR